MKGYGTEKICELLETLFPDHKIQRMDHDTTRKKNAYEEIIEDFQALKIDIMVGTQMIAKGFDFENVSLVGIVDSDSMLNFPDFRSHEFAFQLLTQVSGRSGRKEKQGEVILQTYNTEHELIKYVRNYDYLSFFINQISERELFNYPPFSRIISITLKHRNDTQLNFFSDEFVFYLKKSFGNRVLGPEYPAISKIRNYYLKNILLKIETGKSLEKAKQIIQFVEENLRNQKRLNGCLIIIDVDPL
jgi:primosomal protein N' (replication factor Y)